MRKLQEGYDNGILVKSTLRLHTTNGVLNQSEIAVDKLRQKSHPNSINKVNIQSSLYIKIKEVCLSTVSYPFITN